MLNILMISVILLAVAAYTYFYTTHATVYILIEQVFIFHVLKCMHAGDDVSNVHVWMSDNIIIIILSSRVFGVFTRKSKNKTFLHQYSCISTIDIEYGGGHGKLSATRLRRFQRYFLMMIIIFSILTKYVYVLYIQLLYVYCLDTTIWVRRDRKSLIHSTEMKYYFVCDVKRESKEQNKAKVTSKV